MNNKLSDLNSHLFLQLERLGSKDLSAEQLEQEVKRASAITEVASRITANADLQLKAAKLFAEHGNQVLSMLPQIGKAPTAERPE